MCVCVCACACVCACVCVLNAGKNIPELHAEILKFLGHGRQGDSGEHLPFVKL